MILQFFGSDIIYVYKSVVKSSLNEKDNITGGVAMTEEKDEKVRVSTQLYPDEKRYLQRLADENARSMSGQLRIILLETVEDDDED